MIITAKSGERKKVVDFVIVNNIIEQQTMSKLISYNAHLFHDILKCLNYTLICIH